jgi:hypothetical protein
MKSILVIAVVGILASIGYLVVRPADRQVVLLEPPTSTLTDPVEVFQRAFWKRPAADDKILHAERREWSDDDGVQKWQWFIAVKPSTELLKHLRDDNAFGLVSAAAESPSDDSPTWFTYNPKKFDSLQDPHGEMCVMFAKSGKRLLATGSGGGFRKGANSLTP